MLVGVHIELANHLHVDDPLQNGEETEDNVSAPSSFIANGHNELLYMPFYTGKGGFLTTILSQYGGGGRPPHNPVRICHCSPSIVTSKKEFAQRSISYVMDLFWVNQSESAHTAGERLALA